jgi:hypothetical protein
MDLFGAAMHAFVIRASRNTGLCIRSFQVSAAPVGFSGEQMVDNGSTRN